MNYILIGKFIKPSGLKGEIKTKFYVDDLSELENYNSYYFRDKKTNSYMGLKFSKIKVTEKGVLVKLDGYEDRTSVEIFNNVYFYIDENELPKLKDNEYYIKDILDCEVYYNESKFGIIKNVFEVAGKPIFLIEMNNKKEIAVPMNKNYVESIDIEIKKIIIKSIEYLL